jgi:hypothetical protein
MNATITEKELRQRLSVAKQAPGMAHLPVFGLMAPRGWNFQDPALFKRARRILARASIVGTVTETAPALFWYRDVQGVLRCHFWN